MAVINKIQTTTDTAHSTYISALDIGWINGVPYLFTGSAATNGLASYKISEQGVSFVDQIGYGQNRGTLGLSDIDFVTVGSQSILIPSGRADDRLAFHKINSSGEFSGVSILGASTDIIGHIETSAAMVVKGKTYMVSSQWGQEGFQAFKVREDLSLEHKKTWADSATTYAGDIQAITSDVVDGRSYFFVASAQDTGVSSYWMGQWGNVKARGSLGVDDGVAIGAPTSLATAYVGGQLFLILGDGGRDALTVMKVNKWGGLFEKNSYLDTGETRFANVQTLETFEVGNRAFLLAGGGDDGLSLFEIDPGGALFHIETIEDQLDTTLMNGAAIKAEIIGDTICVFVAGSDEGFTQFSVTLGNLTDSKTGTDEANAITGSGKDDLIAGKDGDDTLDGQGGNDRLIDGAGVDSLRGGAGADVFVFIDDNRLDIIEDFEIGKDRIHLGDFPMLYNFAQLSFAQKSYGVMLSVGDDRIKIVAEDHILQVGEFSASDFIFDF